MSLFAMGDLHLSFAKNKPMDIFGENWKNHAEKIRASWLNQISSTDTVVLPGDLSWAMNLEEALIDLKFIQELPGRKILLSGNHDYWWSSVSKVRTYFPELEFLKNDSCKYEGYRICGTRGWVCPNDTHFTEHDQKIYEREQIRLKLSLDHAMQQGATKLIVLFHYPPTNDQMEWSGFQQVMQDYPVEQVIYGHLHGMHSFPAGIQGEHHGIFYHLVSSDYLDFTFKKIF